MLAEMVLVLVSSFWVLEVLWSLVVLVLEVVPFWV